MVGAHLISLVLAQNLDKLPFLFYGFERFPQIIYPSKKQQSKARCLKRSILVKTLANELPVGTIRFGCKIIDIQMDPLTSLPILQLHDGTVIKAMVVIGCDGVNFVIANFIGLKPPKQSTIGGARGFTNYENGHGFSLEFVTINKGHVLLGRVPLDHNLVFWFVTRPIPPQDLTMSKDTTKIISSTLESVKGFPREMLEMIQNCDVDSLTFNGTRYRAPWELLNARFRKGTVMVAGDAMHVMGPFLGEGGSIALEDAIVLARCLATQRRAEIALEQYIGERRMRLVQISTKTCAIGMLLETLFVVLKLLCIILVVIFFRERLGVDVPKRPGRMSPVLFIWAHYMFGLSNCHGSKSEPKSPNLANRFEKTDFERSAKHGLLYQIQSRHLNVLFWGNLGNPDSLPKATCPSSPKLPRLGNLGTIGEGHFVSTPARPIKDRPLLTMISSFENFMRSYSA
ncbi:unnamed protein product [Camellia sinensis]